MALASRGHTPSLANIDGLESFTKVRAWKKPECPKARPSRSGRNRPTQYGYPSVTNPADVPSPLPWEERLRSATSIRGGYTGQLNTLRRVCQLVVRERPERSVLTKWLQDNLNYEEKNSEDIVRNLLRRGVLESTASKITLSQHARRWYTSGDDGVLIALLHSRIRFFGEMLAELRVAPLAISELLEAAEKYGLSWNTPSQIQQRRGWLESAKLIEDVGNDRLAITEAGHDLLAKLALHRPGFNPIGPSIPEPLPDKKRGGSDYRSPARQKAAEQRRVFEVDPDLIDRGTAAHMDVQDRLAEAVRSAGIVPRSPVPHDPQFDVAWQIQDSAFVAEVKSVTEENEERQLRLGLGQVLSYAFLLDWPGVNDVQPVLAVERPPAGEYWSELCKEHGVILTWPGVFEDLFD